MSDIAETASITLITAVPGSGKTLRAVWYMRDAQKQNEQVFSCNVNGLKLDGVTDFEDPTRWEELPRGSVLIVDECQKFFRADRGVPEYIKAMEEIRHRGIRLILLTQHPALIHGNIRALVGAHEHLVRENGKESATVYTRSRVIDNVRSDKGLAAEDHHTWAFPKDCYDLYKSAEVHTVKRTIPHKYKRAAVMVLVAGSILGFVVWRVNAAMQPDAGSDAQRASQPASDAPQQRRQKIDTAVQYAHLMQPLIDDAPFTAPGFVNREFASAPELYCISSGHMDGENWVADSCKCLTEQGTRYAISLDKCADMSRNGPRYNPYKAPLQNAYAGDARGKESPAVRKTESSEATGASSPRAGVQEFAEPPSYGGMGVGASPR